MTGVVPPRSYPFTPAERLEPDPGLRGCREEPGLVRVQMPYGRPAWLVTRYADVRAVLGDNRFSRAMAIGDDEPRVYARSNTSVSMSTMDAPEHTRLRRVVMHAFTERRIRTLQADAESVAGRLLDEMETRGAPVDLVSAFAEPLPITVLCELLGVPKEDQSDFWGWSVSLLSTAADLPAEQAMQARMRLGKYLASLVEQRRKEPADDLLSAMVQAKDEEERLSEIELVKLGTTLLTAGVETVSSQLVNASYLLLTEPRLLNELVESPSLIPNAVEELIRFVPIGVAGSMFARVAREDVEVGGTLVRAGEAVVTDVQGANFDPAVFADPGRADFTRKEANAHLGFGHGPHHCIGSQLARMELRVGLESLLGRFPKLRLAVPESELAWRTGVVRGPVALPVEW
ncbi:cytochrome P450 [Amycolatopsis sp. cg5]|uniref:cytochrome P450 n=1 Tax=Amycolatopsis sp. cg5 TaxID=3238802 RepID=UPI0035268265